MTKNKITVLLATCDRYLTTLPLTLMSIINQSRLPDKLVLIDDNKVKEFYNHEILKNILYLLKQKNIEFEYYHGKNKGVVPALSIGLNNIEDGWVLKTDDDNILPYNSIEIFEKNIKDDIGAMGGLILDESYINYQNKNPELISKQVDGIYNKIENIYTELNIQKVLNQDNEIKRVDHLYSNYFFNRSVADDYPENLYPSGHREETIFTYAIRVKGYNLIVIPEIKIYHLNLNKNNGDSKWIPIKNEYILLDKLKEYGVIPDKLKIYENENFIYTIKNNKHFKIIDKNE